MHHRRCPDTALPNQLAKMFASRKIIRPLNYACRRLLSFGTFLCPLVMSASIGADPPHETAVRVATYNVSLNRDEPGALVDDLRMGDSQQAARIAEVVQRVRPEVLLLCELDYDSNSEALELFHTLYLARSKQGQPPIEYRHRFSGPVNTGLSSGRDLDRDGQFGGPADAVGFGRHEGQYGMALLSQYPIERDRVRTFQHFLWQNMPGALLPRTPGDDTPYYSPADLAVLRLSSKSFWDVPVSISKAGHALTLHMLCSHPTPPAFDGPEDRNGRRNHDEILMVADYLDAQRGAYLVDDSGRRGAIDHRALFVVAGDLNADPHDGSSIPGAIEQLLAHPLVNAGTTPTSEGAVRAAAENPQQNAKNRGNPAHDTADFGPRYMNLRVDYLLPSKRLRVGRSGVFWPRPGEPAANAVKASDHRLVWLDIVVGH